MDSDEMKRKKKETEESARHPAKYWNAREEEKSKKEANEKDTQERESTKEKEDKRRKQENGKRKRVEDARQRESDEKRTANGAVGTLARTFNTTDSQTDPDSGSCAHVRHACGSKIISTTVG